MTKNIFRTLFLWILTFPLFSQATEFMNSRESNFNTMPISNLSNTIDLLDTVVIDLSNAVYISNYVEIPVSVLSDDTIFALDFSLQYDHTHLIYDTIDDLTAYMISYSYYNTMDSTIRFTSNSFQSYGIDTPLVKVKFILLNGQISISDLYSISGYLNGNLCSTKIIDQLPNSISKREIDSEPGVNFYLNTASSKLIISAEDNCRVDVLDFQGNILVKDFKLNANEEKVLDSSIMKSGYVFIRFNFKETFFVKRLLIVH